MARLYQVLAVAFLGLGPIASAAMAQAPVRTESVTVRAGQTHRVAFYPAAKADCSRTPLPEIKLLEEPKHGKLIVRRASITAGANSACPGQSIPGQLVLFVANANYSGADRLAYGIQIAERKGTVRINLRIVNAKRAPGEPVDI